MAPPTGRVDADDTPAAADMDDEEEVANVDDNAVLLALSAFFAVADAAGAARDGFR